MKEKAEAVKVNGDVITVDPKNMKPYKSYPFTYKGGEFYVFKGKDGSVCLVEKIE